MSDFAITSPCGCCGSGSGSGGPVEVPCCPGVLLPRTVYATFAFSGCGACDRVIPMTFFDGLDQWEGFYAEHVDGAGEHTYLLVRLDCNFGSPRITLVGSGVGAGGGAPVHRIGEYDACALSVDGAIPTEQAAVGATSGICSPLAMTASGTTYARGTCPSTAFTVTVTV